MGSVVADPECLRRREEGETGDEDRSDDIFLRYKEAEEGTIAMEKEAQREEVVKVLRR